jgi:putative spermidine/putrescine transport system ATP-binding protein
MIGSNIELYNVRKAYKDKDVVRDVCFAVNSGEFLSILGPSGAGKTTVLKMIAGFESPTEGKILLEGEDISGKPTHKRNFGMLFQNYALFPHMTVKDNVGFPLQIRKIPKAEKNKRIQEALERVKLIGFDDRFPREMSGGQQQRVALARALVFNPPVLLLDEPMAALDKQLRKHMQLEIKQLHHELGLTTISVTHDQEEALTMATKVCVMHDGKIAQIASPQEIYNRPNSVFVAKFIGEANIIDGNVMNIGKQVISVRMLDGITVDIHENKFFFSEGDDVAVVIRPEKIRLVTESFSGIKIKGVIAQTVYTGESMKLVVKTSAGKSLNVKVFISSTISPHEGDNVLMGIDAEDMVILNKAYN